MGGGWGVQGQGWRVLEGGKEGLGGKGAQEWQATVRNLLIGDPS